MVTGAAALAATLGSALGRKVDGAPAAEVHGGCIGRCWRWETATGPVFVKEAGPGRLGMLGIIEGEPDIPSPPSGLYVEDVLPIMRNNCVFGNTEFNYARMSDPTGINGNISIDPGFLLRYRGHVRGPI